MTQITAQARLIDAAIASFAEHGYHATTTRDIAARAEMSPAALYVHHDSKESLLFEISRSGHEVAADVIREAIAREDKPQNQLRSAVYDFTLWHTENSPLARVVQYEFGALDTEHRRVIISMRRGIEQELAAVVEAGITSGDFSVNDVLETTRAILSLSIDVVRWFDPARSSKGKDIAELYSQLALRMVGVHEAQG